MKRFNSGGFHCSEDVKRITLSVSCYSEYLFGLKVGDKMYLSISAINAHSIKKFYIPGKGSLDASTQYTTH